MATIVVSFTVLLFWFPLRQQPGVGTIANSIIVGLAIDPTVNAIGTDQALWLRVLMLGLGLVLVATGSGLYLGCYLGPGARDGLMTGLRRRTGWSIRAIRNTIEVLVASCGFLLGGTVGIGTVVFALAVGPAVQLALRAMRVHRLDDL